jgi:hypothetical protein
MQQRSRQYLLAGDLIRAVDWSKNVTQLKTISFVFITFCSPVTADTEACGTQMGIPPKRQAELCGARHLPRKGRK